MFLGCPLASRRATSRWGFSHFGNCGGVGCRDRPGRPSSRGEHATRSRDLEHIGRSLVVEALRSRDRGLKLFRGHAVERREWIAGGS